MSVSINGGLNAINLASKASPKVVERFKIGSCTEGLFSQDYDWTGVATVEVRSIDTLPLQNYSYTTVDGSSRFGAISEVGDTVQELTVSDDKSFNGTIDKRNNTSVMQTKAAGSILKRQTDEVLIPYVDKYRLQKLAANAGEGYFLGNTALSSSNIIEHIMKANAQMSNNKVPDTGRVLFMGYTLAVDLKLASQVVGIDSIGEQAIVNGAMGKVDKCQVRLVPDDYMPSGVNFMIVKTGCAVAPKKIETYRVLNNVHIIDGAMVQGRMLHDCFVLDAKDAGVLVCMAEPYSISSGVTGDAASIVHGNTLQLNPSFKTVSGGKDIKLAAYTYTSSATTYATVDADGLITGVAAGSSNVKIKLGTTEKTVAITVT